jgi:nucleoside-diphosphate-sugar epimerase
MKEISQVYHVAGLVSFNNSNRKQLNSTNVKGTANVVNACIENSVDKLCHVSSIAALGEAESPAWIDEKPIWKQSDSASAYSRSKFLGEMEVWRGIHEGLNAVIVNPSVIIGPGMWLGPGKELLSRVQKGLNYYASGSSGYVDVRDVARIMVILTEGAYNRERFIINSENITHRHYLNLIADALDKPRPTRVISPVLGKIAVGIEFLRSAITRLSPRIDKQTLRIAFENLAFSNDKVREATGISFISAEESVKTAIKLYLEKPGAALQKG